MRTLRGNFLDEAAARWFAWWGSDRLSPSLAWLIILAMTVLLWLAVWWGVGALVRAIL
jgi:hypothetical protein